MTTQRVQRTFSGAPAKRARISLWIGLYGASGSGKTYSALRLARGIQSVVGGVIGVADTQNKQALHYADEFQFRHYPFDPPFDPLSYRDLLEQMAAEGVTIAIIDSASHEHDGPGGVLEMHESETQRLVAAWGSTPDAVKGAAWIVPKRQRAQMIDAAMRTGMHIIWCLRAQRKLDYRDTKKIGVKGYMPIGAETLVYDMPVRALLMPGAKGVPTWNPKEVGEREMVRLPHWAQKMLRQGQKLPLDEDFGEKLARWASGEEDPNQQKPEPATDEERSTFLDLYSQLTKAEIDRLGISRVITDTAQVAGLARPRLLKGIEIMRAALNPNQEVSE
jgi:hypothetical protein